MKAASWVVLAVACGGGASPPPNKPSSGSAAGPVDPDPLVDGVVEAPPHATTTVKLDLPAVPGFELPPASADGSRSVKELRVDKRWLDGEVTVKGVVTWVYDCATAIRTPAQSEKAVRDLIDKDPTLCERPKLYVGDTADTPPEHSLWVVDVPRPYNKLELQRIKKADRTMPDRCEASDKHGVCPPYRVGDEVVITGTFTRTSPHAERNSDGLVVYKWMKNVTQRWQSPGAAPPPGPVQPATPPYVDPPVPRPVRPPMTQIRASVMTASLDLYHLGLQQYAGKQYDVAIASYRHAVERWSGNHAAWYALAAAYAQRRDWDQATDAANQAVGLAPDVAMYQLVYGWFAYEQAVTRARDDLAKKQNKQPADVEVDYATVNFGAAYAHLSVARALNPELWRASYLIGRIHRAAGRAKLAADAFTQALAHGARDSGPWLALAELYRAWDYTDAAIVVAMIGTTTIEGDDDDRSLAWFELGIAYADKRLDAKAIEAFGKSLEIWPDNPQARFARGQSYFRTGDLTKAKADLEQFAKSAPAGMDFHRQSASRMLMDISVKKAR